MMRLTESAVSEIRASQGCYRQADVARAYEVSESTVYRIWQRKYHPAIEAAPEPPNIEASKTPELIKDDVLVLANRGMSKGEIARELGISLTTVYRCLPRWYF